MSKPTDNPADPFKKALAEATKTMADDPDLTVSYSVDPPGMTDDSVRLPQVSRRMTRDEVLLARGTADAFALRRRYHDAKLHLRYEPTGQMARDLYEAMETARCEAVGARTMPGTAGNIDAKIAHEADRKGYGQITKAEDAPLASAAGYLVRHLATGRPLPKGAGNVMELWRGFIEQQAGGTLADLDETLADQAAFARLARRVIADLGYGDQLGEDPDLEDEDEGDEAEEDEENPDSQSEDEDQSEDAEASPEQSQEDQQDQSQAQVSMEDDAEAEMSEDTEMPEGEAPLEPPPPPPHSDADPNYAVYCTDFDEEIRAEELAEPAELERLRAYLDQQLEPLKGAVGRLANKLQRRLAGAAEPLVGVRPRGGHPRRRPPGPRRRQPDHAAQLQAGEGHRVPRHRRDAAAGQLRLDARPADLDRRDLRRRAGPHAGTLRREGGNPRLHHPRLEGRAEPRTLAGGGPAAAAGAAERPAPHHLQVRRRAVAAGAAEPRPDDEGRAAEGEHRRRGAGMGAPPDGRPARGAQDPDGDLRRRPGGRFQLCRSTPRTISKNTCAT